MKLNDIFTDKKTLVFTLFGEVDDNELNCIIKPTKFEAIPDEEGYFFVKAIEVTPAGLKDCYLEVITPERIAENVIKKDKKGLTVVESIYDQEFSIIPAIPSEASGDYELYYAEEDPSVGIEILKKGLDKVTNKSVVAEDLGYLLRDEERYEEAIEAFKISEENGPSSEYTYLELSDLYAELEDDENQQYYLQKFKDNGGRLEDDIEEEEE
jgi:tetratricopeptide (TPR) repeat protein